MVNKKYIPIFVSSLQKASSRSKFNAIDDNLLLLGITKFGSKQMEKIKDIYLQDKSVIEIKHRYKNLICQKA